MKNKSVPQVFRTKPTVEAFLSMDESTKKGWGKGPKKSRLRKRNKNKHGRQHP